MTKAFADKNKKSHSCEIQDSNQIIYLKDYFPVKNKSVEKEKTSFDLKHVLDELKNRLS